MQQRDVIANGLSELQGVVINRTETATGGVSVEKPKGKGNAQSVSFGKLTKNQQRAMRKKLRGGKGG